MKRDSNKFLVNVKDYEKVQYAFKIMEYIYIKRLFCGIIKNRKRYEYISIDCAGKQEILEAIDIIKDFLEQKDIPEN